jgi:hypothetical protein
MEDIVIVLLIDYMIYVEASTVPRRSAVLATRAPLCSRIESQTTSKLGCLLRSLASSAHYVVEARP